jgi:hypothetical protein
MQTNMDGAQMLFTCTVTIKDQHSFALNLKKRKEELAVSQLRVGNNRAEAVVKSKMMMLSYLPLIL